MPDPVLAAAVAYLDALDAAKEAAKRKVGLERWAELDAKAAVSLRDLRIAVRARRGR